MGADRLYGNRWYVRGYAESHVYDLEVPLVDRPGEAFCQTCLTVHARPVGQDWHIEGESVDYMLCGVRVGLDEGEVRQRPVKHVCARCEKIATVVEETN